jgi:CRISPR/Cas system-associated endonuclease Cas3-HD
MGFGIFMQWTDLINELFILAEPFLEARGDLLHTRIAHQYSLYLMEKEGGDKRIVEPAVILHDVGWSELKPHEIKMAYGVRAAGGNAARLNRIHEVMGAVIARQILENLAYEQEHIEQITAIIEQHDSGTQIRTLEEAVVKDSDKLWRVSQIGFWAEGKRQNVASDERYRFLMDRYKKWFFTKSAVAEAGKELEIRRRAILIRNTPWSKP